MWKKERDLLVAQTLAFVQSVAGMKGDAKADAGLADDRMETIKPGIDAALMEAIRLVAPRDTHYAPGDVEADRIQANNIEAPAFQRKAASGRIQTCSCCPSLSQARPSSRATTR